MNDRLISKGGNQYRTWETVCDGRNHWRMFTDDASPDKDRFVYATTCNCLHPGGGTMIKVMKHERILRLEAGVAVVCSGYIHWHIWEGPEGQEQRFIGECDCAEPTVRLGGKTVPAWWDDPMP